jgi:hypothetical protein
MELGSCVLCWEVPLVKLMHDSMIVKMGFPIHMADLLSCREHTSNIQHRLERRRSYLTLSPPSGHVQPLHMARTRLARRQSNDAMGSKTDKREKRNVWELFS